MEKLLLTNLDNSTFEVELIRYFSYDQDYYLIYTLNEKDDKNYLKLYLVEILEELGEPIVQNIKDEDEWKNMQNIVKKVIKEIKAGTRDLLKDESPLMLEKIMIDEPRYFKLDEKLANILASNYSYSINSEMTMEEMNSIQDNISENDFIIEPIDLPSDEVIILETEDSETMKIDEKDLNITPNDEIVELSNTEIVDNEKDEQEMDYKALYFALKEEKEATDVLLDDLLQKLLKYKEKYGELE